MLKLEKSAMVITVSFDTTDLIADDIKTARILFTLIMGYHIYFTGIVCRSLIYKLGMLQLGSLWRHIHALT